MLLSASKMSEVNNIEAEIEWIKGDANYAKMSNQDLQDQNKKIIHTLKMIEAKLDKQLEHHKKTMNLQPTQQSHSNREKVLTESIKNNETIIKVLEKELRKVKDRNQELKNGLQAKVNTKKYELEKRFADLKNEVKRMKLEQKQINKRLSNHENASEPESLSENIKLEEELRVYSIKYMKMLQKYNKVTEQLAIASSSAQPELVIPEQFYDQELEVKQEAQYKEYQGIVKMCTILSKRNDSENNKLNRIYTEKLKELEKTIFNLGQIDRNIALREGEIIEGKKNIELFKFKINNNEKIEDPFLSLSQSSLRKNSYSLSRLPSYSRQTKDRDWPDLITRKLSKKI